MLVAEKPPTVDRRHPRENFGKTVGLYLFFGGNKWVGWREYIPLKKAHFKEMFEVMKFYGFMRPTPISKIGHNHLAAFSYIGMYSLIALEMLTGLVMFNTLRHSALL